MVPVTTLPGRRGAADLLAGRVLGIREALLLRVDVTDRSSPDPPSRAARRP
ncbi:hypothetical protein SGUI_1457 [Serinicoccus hydrothermalis]|uniref:Uncharacterized protein n=1 Tax=Serinicoccus hydrothermalis TaxID=1758689 RepID=A0A1B1NBQ0_9MICO|nr:hypothetical protein SGUI_1457 [Serinicoccus hydrothermalis]